MIKTRCKFQVVEVARMNWGSVKREGKPDTQVERIKLNAVYASDSQED